MKTIFKSILIAASLLLTVNASAQDSPLQFGVKAGMNLSNFGGDLDDTKAKIGFNAGVTVDYGFTPDWYLMTGLEFTIKGCKNDTKDVGDAKTNISYLQLPVHVGYKLAIAENTKLVFHAGPYVAYGLSGKEKYKENGVGTDIDIFKEYNGQKFAKRFDFGVGLGVGVEFGKIGVGLGYDFGLANISDVNNVSIKNQNGYLTVGYKF